MSAGTSEVLAAHAADRRFEDLDEAALVKTRQLVLDALGCAIGGAESALGRAVAATVATGGPCTLVGRAEGAPASDAAFANALLVNALDYDDTDHAGHPGSTVVAAALAAAEIAGASGRRLLLAVALGQQLSSRVSAAIKPTWERYQRVHGSGTPQTFGAAAAAGVVLGLDAERLADAYGIAGAFAPVPHAAKFGWDEPQLAWAKDNVGRAADGGLRAALLARAGFRGSRTILDGDRGFAIMAGSDQFSPEFLTADLGRWDILDLSFKPYPCCRWIHTTLDALAELVARERLRPDQIERVEVRTISSVARTFADPAPATMVDGQFSVPYTVACALLGVPHRDWHRDETLRDPRVRDLAVRVRLAEDPAHQRRYLERGRLSWFVPATVAVRTAEGRRPEAYAEVARGSPLLPLGEAQLRAKFTHLAAPRLGDPGAAALADRLLQLDDLDDVRGIAPALRAIGGDR